MGFNSRLREEATRVRETGERHCERFNSRLREEATSVVDLMVENKIGFNSRLREEATTSDYCKSVPAVVSTHASVRRRLDTFYKPEYYKEFQLTPP